MGNTGHVVLRAAWMPADNKEKRTKGQWHKWFTEPFNYMVGLILNKDK